MIFVDAPVWKKSPNGRKTYSHMAADDLTELHEFAEKIGVKKHFFHKAPAGWHYDITADQFLIAIAQGAVRVSSKEVLKKAKNLLPASMTDISDAIRNFAEDKK